ncbi:CIC11C00000003342 [Sungouiella intermedia]|uniref:CIC11C00000003342 n=1 Tax=Sungouiella intermedia TaxID=45354 RepID=A0A1L0D7L7_9ASCO|nr:CIC11C00000003342 [[Candida] intermedia]
MSLIQDSIATMGDPNTQTVSGLPSSINFSHSFKDWWNSSSSLQRPTEKTVELEQFVTSRSKNAAIEFRLFRAILSSQIYLVDPLEPELSDISDTSDHRIVGRFLDTDLSTEDQKMFIHEFEISNKSNPELPQRHIVIIHGYMAALGYFVKNFEPLVKLYGNLVVHAIDMPGFGNSARPLFPKELIKLPKNATLRDEIKQIMGVENWFIDTFEQWRIKKGIDKFVLVAHSMGAYLSSCYLLKYNKQNDGSQLVDKFVLVSPMGTESSDVSLINHKDLQFNHHESGGDPFQEIFTNQDFKPFEVEHEDLNTLWEKLGKPKFPKNTVLRKLWEWNVLPFQVLQYLGPMYLKILSLWSFQRFKNLKANNSEDGPQSNTDLILKLHEYSFSIFNQYQGSGELAITKLINHEILARLPLCDRGLEKFLTENNISTLWMYGDKDWMNMKGGEYCVEKLKQLGDKNSSLVIAKDAGHHIYLDNPDEFNKMLIDFIDFH